MVNCSYRLLSISIDSYVTRTGFQKVTHEFIDCGSFDSLDSVVLGVLDHSDGRFRVLCHIGKKLRTYNVVKCGSVVTFG